MRILVTGVNGQVGGALVPRLQRLGTVLATDRKQLDLSQPSRIAAALDQLAPDMIVNPAAYTAVDRAEDERELAFTVNAESPGVIAHWAAQRGVPLVQLSTDYVFDGSGERAWREHDPTGPLSVYGASKLAGEKAVQAASGAHLIVRTSWVYAAQGNNFLRTIARLARERTELRVVDDQLGAPTSAALIADILTRIVAGDVTTLVSRFAAAGGITHLAASGCTSWCGFATAIVDGLRAHGEDIKTERLIPIRTEEYPTKAVRPRNSRLDLTRLREVFGVTPVPWTSALPQELDQFVPRRLEPVPAPSSRYQ
jgi:dTDP-4-dehydrorhamnose reductase